MDLSIICPAIRVDRWVNVYNSIDKSFSGEWELIFVTSKELPEELKDKKNIQVIPSRRSPMAKQQLGLTKAKGEWITVISDDSVFKEGMLDEVFKNKSDKEIIVMKYLEGEEFDFPAWYHEQVEAHRGFKTNYDFMRDDMYYFCGTHDSSKMEGIAPKAPILSVALIKKSLLEEVGGWDCRLQSQAMGNIDLAARFCNLGYEYEISNLVVSQCGYMKQDTGDHSAIHYAQLDDDQPLLDEWYSVKNDRGKIDINNWESSSEIWERGGDAN